MSVQMGHLKLVQPAASAAGRPGEAPVPGLERPEFAPATVTADVIPASPPVEVSEEVARAAERAQELHDANRELHFAKDPESGRIVVEVRDLDGNVLRIIPPSEALDVMSGHAGI
jgi:flagellar protein FlaG